MYIYTKRVYTYIYIYLYTMIISGMKISMDIKYFNCYND